MAAGWRGLRVPRLTLALAWLLVAAAPTSAADPWLLASILDEEGVKAAAVEPDPRTVPWHTLRRLALLGGEFVAPYRPLSNEEIAGQLRRVWRRGGPRLLRPAARRQLAWLLARHGRQTRPGRWATCACREPRVHASLGGRVALHELGPGDVVVGEAGLAARGLLATVEPELAVWGEDLWLGATPRLELPLDDGGRGADAALRYRGWPEPTGRPAAGRARDAPAVRVAAARLAAGLRLGHWALTGGLQPAAVGVGLDGAGLSLAPHARPVPQLVLRRTRPFAWSGILRWFDPEHLLLRVGSVTAQDVRYESVRGLAEHRARPLLTQWLVTWDHTPWWRTTVVGTALSAARAGRSLWPDLLQVNLPLLDATWNEVDYGPVTDRLVSLVMEARWRDAPWPGLPAAAGRVWWEYGGEDFRPHDQLPGLPEISAPANLAGVELVDDRWDVAVEFLDTRHPRVLWYENAGFPEGYAHDGILLGHALGGAAEAWTACLRWRPGAGATEWVLRGRTVSWRGDRLPSDARRRELSLAGRRLDGTGRWTARLGWVEEEVGPVRERWWRASLQRQF